MKPTKEKIIQIFNKALKKAKNKKVNFIAISDVLDGTLEVKSAEIIYTKWYEVKGIKPVEKIIIFTINDFMMLLEDWQEEELYKNSLAWLKK